MNYEEAIQYIHSVNWTFCKPGLERISELCEGLNNPQNTLKFIHVAGTNGKGSFCSMLSSVLKEAGYRVGTFTSPYVKFFNERMAINGEPISDGELCDICEYVKPIADSMTDKPTEFELITAIAFEYFARNKCDIVVLECGLGGRLDSTNIIRTPILSVITGIALDHTSILGDTVEKIAQEKAGIIKDGVPCLWCGEHKGAEKIIRTVAGECSAPVFIPDRSTLSVKKADLSGTEFDFGEHKGIKISLLGTYQPINASNALCAVDIMRANGYDISEKAVKNGLLRAVWHARFEIISREPLIIADGGHNPEGVDAAVDSVLKYFGNERVNIVCGVMADKDYAYIARRISGVAHRVFCLTPENPRALPAEELARVFNGLGCCASAHGSVGDAVISAINSAKQENRATVCLGSLYMYKEITEAVDRYKSN